MSSITNAIEAESLQAKLFTKVLSLFSSKGEAVDSLLELLQIGKSSLYRKINDQSALKPEEIAMIIRHYSLSLDELVHQKNSLYLFSHAKAIVDFRSHNSKEPLEQIVEQLKSVKDVLIYYAGVEIPMNYVSYFPELVYFKECIWLRNQEGKKKLNYNPFNFKDIPADSLERYQATAQFFEGFQMIELWDKRGMTSMVEQIRHYYHIGMLMEGDALMLVQRLGELLDLLEKMLKIGSRTLNPEDKNMAVYFNPIPSPNWFYIVDSETIKYVQAVFDTPNSLISFNSYIFENAKRRFEAQRQQAHLISNAGTVERRKLFDFYRKQIAKLEIEIQ